MMKARQFPDDLFFTSRFFLLGGFLALCYLSAYFLTWMMSVAHALLFMLTVLLLIDLFILFITKNQIVLQRQAGERWSLGDANTVTLSITSNYPFRLHCELIDELPFQFQERNFMLRQLLAAGSSIRIPYTLQPHERGEYEFGNLHAYVTSPLNLIQRRFTAEAGFTTKVYPSFLQLKKFQIRSLPNQHDAGGGRRQFRRGNSTEFDHIKEYTRGDDARTINWKASARRHTLMINSFMDEKSQQIYCLLDKGRLMKMPFNNLSLLDYSINAILMFSYVALQKDDKIGLISFAEKTDDNIPASKSKKQFNVMMEALYHQTTGFAESNFEGLYTVVDRKAGHRSLLLLFTNFETLSGFERQLPYLKAMNRKHLLCVILFENTEVTELLHSPGDQLEDIYIKTIAGKFMYEKKMIVRELQKNGILAIYTTPAGLTVNVINKYLELKAKQTI